MAKGSTTKAPEKGKGKPVSGIIPTIEGGDAMPEQDEPEFVPPDPADVEALAVQLALGAGEHKPRATLGGVPRWRQWEAEARGLIIAFNLLTGRKSK